jgi:hypothetical protein
VCPDDLLVCGHGGQGGTAMSESVERAKTVKFKSFPKGMLFDEYRLFIEDTARFSDRRQTFSNFMVVMNGFLVTGVCAVLKDPDAHTPARLAILLALLGAGLAAACVWRKVFVEYDEIIGIRVDFLRQIECKAGKDHRDGMYHMLGAKVYDKEIAIAGTCPRARRRRGFTPLEKWLPWIFIALYCFFLVTTILAGLWSFCLILVNYLCLLS